MPVLSILGFFLKKLLVKSRFFEVLNTWTLNFFLLIKVKNFCQKIRLRVPLRKEKWVDFSLKYHKVS